VKAYGGVDVEIHRERAPGMGDVENGKILTLLGLELLPLGCPARSQSIYRLRYPGSNMTSTHSLTHAAEHFLRSRQL
jgi:hypothetical protein